MRQEIDLNSNKDSSKRKHTEMRKKGLVASDVGSLSQEYPSFELLWFDI